MLCTWLGSMRSIPVSALVFVVAFALFATMAASGLTWMDPGELAQAAFNLGGAHPPGHPGHSLLGKLATLVPVGEVAFRLNILSAAAMAAALAGVYALARTLLAGQVMAASVAIVLAALSPVLQINAVRTEVYAPAAALIVWSMVAVVRFARQARPSSDSAADGRLLLLAALGLGLAVAFHPLIAASAGVPMAGAAVLALWPERHRLRRLVPMAVTLALLGVLLYAYLPARSNAASPPLLMWGDPASLDALIAVITGAVYRDNFDLGNVGSRFVELFILAADGPGAALVWGGLIGLGFAALTGLRGTGVVLASALAVIAAAATQSHTNPDMPGYVLPALLFLAAGLAPLCGALQRFLPEAWSQPGWRSGVATSAILAPLVGFALVAPAIQAAEHGDSGFQRGDGPLRLWSDTVAPMAPGPGVYFADGDHALFAAQYERLVAGSRPDIAVANAELCRDRWFMAHIERMLPALHVPFIDDGVRGNTAARLAVQNLRMGRPVGGDRPEVGKLGSLGAVPLGRGYVYVGDRGPDEAAELAPVMPPPELRGSLGSKIARRIGLARARYELERGRFDRAAIAAGLAGPTGPTGPGAQFDTKHMALLATARPVPERPALAPLLPRMTRSFISSPWHVELIADEIAWMAGLPEDWADERADERADKAGNKAADAGRGGSRSSRPVPPERRLHASWRLALTWPEDDPDGVWEVFSHIAELGQDAEMATAQVLVRAGQSERAEAFTRQVIERRGGDYKNLVLLGSIIGNRNTIAALAEAEELFKRAAELAPGQAEPWVALGVAQRKQGKIEPARQSWLRALELDPGRRDAASFLRSLEPR